MRLTAAQRIQPINREGSQAERRRFEPGHPLISSELMDLVDDLELVRVSLDAL